MTVKQRSFSSYGLDKVTPFLTAAEAWFWFIDAQEARNAGARVFKGAGLQERPCEPVDILTVLDRLYRKRRLLRDHLLVLRHYGRRKMAPDPRRAKEKRAALIWDQALAVLGEALQAKGIVALPKEEATQSLWDGIPLAELGQAQMDHLWQQGVGSCR